MSLTGNYLVDLHCHTTESDGSLTPEELVQYAHAKNVRVLAITDHEKVSGYFKAKELAKQFGIVLLPGVEIDCGAFDIIGININPHDRKLVMLLKKMLREKQQKILKKIRFFQGLGLQLNQSILREHSEGQKLSNRTIARMFQAQGIPGFEDLNSGQQRVSHLLRLGKAEATMAFKQHQKKSALQIHSQERLREVNSFVRARELEESIARAREAMQTILEAGGTPILAHPMRSFTDKKSLIDCALRLKTHGLKGIEAYYPAHSKEEIAFLRQFANQERLVISGGTDFHTRGDRFGDIAPRAVAEIFLKRFPIKPPQKKRARKVFRVPTRRYQKNRRR